MTTGKIGQKIIKKRILDVKRHRLLFGTIDFNGQALDEFGSSLKGYKDPIPFFV